MDANVVAAARELISGWVESTPPQKIFNMDETGLFYNLEPNRQLIELREKRELRGTKKQKERVTIALTTNWTGDVKLRPMLIGKSTNPRAFRNFRAERYVHYANNPTAWMNNDTFKMYLA